MRQMMKKPLVLALCAMVAVPLFPTLSLAGPIETACMRSDRERATRSLCRCIQEAADMTLRGSDQRRAAKFFRDPDLAHKTWVSQKAADDAFWERYKEFGARAEAFCGG
jgi:hypothetical protein